MTAGLEIPFPPGRHEIGARRPEAPLVPIEPRWEYRTVVRGASDPMSEGELNLLGQEGWELAGVAPAGAQVHFYFKRERIR
jgi:hypothetical protein